MNRLNADDYPENEDGVRCLRCGQEGCYWQDTWNASGVRKPKLYQDGQPHVCAPSTDDFEVVS